MTRDLGSCSQVSAPRDSRCATSTGTHNMRNSVQKLRRIRLARRTSCVAPIILFAIACYDEPATSPTGPRITPATSPPVLVVGQAIPDRYIVTLRSSSIVVASEAASINAAAGGQIVQVYEHALRGFAAELSPAQLS